MSGSPQVQLEEALRLRHGPAADQARLRALAETDAGLAALLADWDRQDAALRALYAPVAEEPVPDHLRTMIAAASRAEDRPPARSQGCPRPTRRPAVPALRQRRGRFRRRRCGSGTAPACAPDHPHTSTVRPGRWCRAEACRRSAGSRLATGRAGGTACPGASTAIAPDAPRHRQQPRPGAASRRHRSKSLSSRPRQGSGRQAIA